MACCLVEIFFVMEDLIVPVVLSVVNLCFEQRWYGIYVAQIQAVCPNWASEIVAQLLSIYVYIEDKISVGISPSNWMKLNKNQEQTVLTFLKQL